MIFFKRQNAKLPKNIKDPGIQKYLISNEEGGVTHNFFPTFFFQIERKNII